MNDDSQRVDEVLGRIKNIFSNNDYSAEEIRAVIEGLMEHAEDLEKDEKAYKEKMN